MKKIKKILASKRGTAKFTTMYCPLCTGRIRCDGTYAAPYKHLLAHLYNCPGCGSSNVAEDPMGGRWCQECDYVWHPALLRNKKAR